MNGREFDSNDGNGNGWSTMVMGVGVIPKFHLYLKSIFIFYPIIILSHYYIILLGQYSIPPPAVGITRTGRVQLRGGVVDAN